MRLDIDYFLFLLLEKSYITVLNLALRGRDDMMTYKAKSIEHSDMKNMSYDDYSNRF